jgi:hypothetical protein
MLKPNASRREDARFPAEKCKFPGVTKTVWTSSLAFLTLFPKWRWRRGKCMAWNPQLILPRLSLPSPSPAWEVCSHSLKPLVWSFCQTPQNEERVQLHQPGLQPECKSSQGLGTLARNIVLGKSPCSAHSLPLVLFQDLPSLLQFLSEGKVRAVCAWCERHVNKAPFHINSTSQYYQIMLLTLPAGRGLHLEIISSNWEASKVPFPRQRAS